VRAPGENLRKAQVQFALVRDIEQQERSIRAIIRDAFAKGDIEPRPAEAGAHAGSAETSGRGVH